MSSAGSLKDVCIEEMRDLWSANDQMQGVIQSLSEKASDSKLKEMLAKSVGGIGQHTAILKSILEARGGNIGKDHCKGMKGLGSGSPQGCSTLRFSSGDPAPVSPKCHTITPTAL